MGHKPEPEPEPEPEPKPESAPILTITVSENHPKKTPQKRGFFTSSMPAGVKRTL